MGPNSFQKTRQTMDFQKFLLSWPFKGGGLGPFLPKNSNFGTIAMHCASVDAEMSTSVARGDKTPKSNCFWAIFCYGFGVYTFFSRKKFTDFLGGFRKQVFDTLPCINSVLQCFVPFSVLSTILGAPGGLRWLFSDNLPDKTLRKISKALERVHCWYCKVKLNTLDHSIMSIGSNMGCSVVLKMSKYANPLELRSGFEAIFCTCASRTFLDCLLGLSYSFIVFMDCHIPQLFWLAGETA